MKSEIGQMETYERIIDSREFDAKIESAFNAGFEIGKRHGYLLGHCDAILEQGEFDDSPKAHNWCCDCCDAEFFGTVREAIAAGWEAAPGAEFCGLHRG